MSRQLFSLLEVALKLGISEMTVRRAVKRGAIKAIIVGGKYRISQQAIDDYLKEVTP